jgi:hypothetical protein
MRSSDSVSLEQYIIEKGHKLTTEQKKIIHLSPETNICVNACPGSGKTQTLIYRVAYLHYNCKIPLEEIALFTYNRFLADDMISKLEEFNIKKDNLGWCGTVHSLCYVETQKMDDLIAWIDKFSSTGYPPSQQESIANDQNEIMEYDDDLPDEVLDAMKDHEESQKIIKQIRERHRRLKYIIFDEYQDADQHLSSVIEILSRERYLMIVGDERQQIYGSRGANAEYLLNVKSDFVKLSLSMSFRCNKHICKLLSRLYPSYPEIMSTREGDRPCLYRSIGSSIHDPAIIERILEIIAKSREKEYTVAILSPTVNSGKSQLFLNDIHSNLNRQYPGMFQFSSSTKKSDEKSKSQDQVKGVISSIHGVKGREYDVVIILNVIDAKFFFDAPEAEDLCKLFVACSRARYQLHLFEHLFGPCSGSLEWIHGNEDVIDVISQTTEPRPRSDELSGSGSHIKSSSDYLRSIKQEDRKKVISYYSEPELIAKEDGLGEIFYYGNYDPKLMENLIEWALTIQMTGKRPEIDFTVYITNQEWRYVKKNRCLPQSILKKIVSVYDHRYIGIFLEDKIFIGPFEESHFEPICSISESNIVSTLICNEYYQYLPMAQKIYSEIFIDPENSNNDGSKINRLILQQLWWIVRFNCLSKLSLVGFNQPDLDDETINRLLSYFRKSSVMLRFSKLGLKCHLREDDLIDPDSQLRIIGQVDFISPDGIIDLSCNVDESSWIEVMIHNHLFRNHKFVPSPSNRDISNQTHEKKGLNLLSFLDHYTPHNSEKIITSRFINDNQVMSNDNQVMSNDNQVMSNNSQVMSNNSQVMSNNNQVMSNDNQVMSNDNQVMSRGVKSNTSRRKQKLRKTNDQYSQRVTEGKYSSSIYLYNPISGELWKREWIA